MLVALTVGTKKGITLTSGKLPSPSPLHSDTGISGSCKSDRRNMDGVITVDLDAKLTGKSEVTVKGHLDVVCHEGL
jgi:hypothetical protein